jgi:hypothetical protein
VTALSRGALLVVATGVFAASAFLFNKKLNLDAGQARQAAEAFVFEQQRKCAVDGRSWAEEYRRQEQTSAYNFQLAEWDPPRFHYSRELQACLVRTRSVDFRDDLIYYEHQRVTDITGNQPILESSVRLVRNTSAVPGSPPTEEPSDIVKVIGENLSRAEFAKRADELMKSGIKK